MTEAPQSYGQTWASDERPELPQTGDERTMLTAYLDHHRATFELKCRGVDPARLNDRTMPPSTLTLHGLLRHLTGVERWWFQINFAGDQVPLLYYSDDDPDQDFERLDGDVEEAFAVWRQECERSREIVAAHRPRRRGDAGPRRRAGIAARRPAQDDRGVRPSQRSRRPAPRGHRRGDGVLRF